MKKYQLPTLSGGCSNTLLYRENICLEFCSSEEQRDEESEKHQHLLAWWRGWWSFWSHARDLNISIIAAHEKGTADSVWSGTVDVTASLQTTWIHSSPTPSAPTSALCFTKSNTWLRVQAFPSREWHSQPNLT